jgi:predicted nucleotidyltransferase
MDPIEALRSRLVADPHVSTAWLYGSQARGTARATSDFDVAVLWDDPSCPAELAFDLEAALCASLGREVQVVIAHRAPADLIRRVLRDGILLVDRDRSARIAFEVRKRNEYFDMVPTWRRIRRLAPDVAP